VDALIERRDLEVFMVAIALLLLSQAAAPAQQGPAAQGQSAQKPSAQKQAELLWLGQSAFRITTPGGKVIVIDPFLTKNPKTPAAFKDLDALGKVDLLLVTHAHGDHLGDAVALATKNKAPLYAPAGLNQTLQTLGVLPADLAPRMNKGGTITPLGPGIRIHMVRAEHSSEFVYHDPKTDKDETLVGGEPVGFVLELENGVRIYHMGDTALFGDMRLIAERLHPDVVLIPIGGHFVMDPQDAAFAVREWLKPKFALPMHYGTTPLLKGTPEEFKAALGNAPVKVIVLQPGEKATF
jgi:L-ascorbate metabolism protein UlaG (beta-lactamase superfamily)